MSGCAHCGLPAPAGARYCCFGCELAARVQAEARDDHGRLYGRLAFTLVLSMIVMMLSLFLYAEDVFDLRGDVEMAWLRSAYRWASLILATPVMALAGGPLIKRAIESVRAKRLSMDALIVLGAFAAYGLSIDALMTKKSGIYFESATAAIVLATFGRYLEATARSRASRSLGPLLEVARGSVRLCEADGTRAIAAADIAPGMTIEVPAGQVVPVDLALSINEGARAEVDLAVLTGESRPVSRGPGETVPAGAVPVFAAIRGTALRGARDSALERLASLAATLSERPAGVLRWADRFAGVLTPLAAAVALAALVGWTRAASLDKGIVAALAVALAACPCSYAIAAPLVHWLMLRRALARGVLVRSADALEALAGTRVVAFDKTGTLTRAEQSVVGERLAPGVERAEAMALIAALEADSVHPIGRALLAHAAGATRAKLLDLRHVPGRGVDAIDEAGRAIRLGAGAGGAIVLSRDGATLTEIVLDEELRPEAIEAVESLRHMGIRVVLLSGDDPARVERVARRLGVEASARLSPEQKMARLDGLGGRTAMVGDGVNDAPALAGRLTSFTLGGAAQLAKGVAQVTLLEPDLRLVPWTIELARRGIRLVAWLLALSTAYNLAFVALAAAGALRPVWAGLSMLGSSLLSLSFAAGIGGAGEAVDDEAREAAEAIAC